MAGGADDRCRSYGDSGTEWELEEGSCSVFGGDRKSPSLARTISPAPPETATEGVVVVVGVTACPGGSLDQERELSHGNSVEVGVTLETCRRGKKIHLQIDVSPKKAGFVRFIRGSFGATGAITELDRFAFAGSPVHGEREVGARS
ncbi:hypothetical protein QJS10_CPA06g01121 [Acorus calamus]|uniref:Uncharacterized protein n=1 Tax=Acorus calamus TaxID=4465 RepID=A0AAV9EPB0_ACOCL|nr:hypothetical protein QJS10_CPA06g01121 [Acorus calamus]